MTVVELKKIKEAYQPVSYRSLKTEEPSDTTDSVDTKPGAAETQSAAVDEAVVIDVKAAAEEHEYAVAVQELTEPVTDQLKSVEAELDEVVDVIEAVKDESVEAKAVETNIIEMDSVEDVVHPESNDKEAVAASVETEVADEETTVSDDVKENLLAEAVTRTEPTEREVVAAEVNGDVKAASDSSDKVSVDKEGAPNEGLTAHATDEELANERISAESSDEVASVVKADAIKAVAVENAAGNKLLDEAELVTQNMDLSVAVAVTDQTVKEVVAEIVADAGTDKEAFSTDTRFSAEGHIERKVAEVDIERKVAEVTNEKAVPVDEEVEMDEAVVKEVETAAAAPTTEIDEAVVKGTETSSSTEIPEVFVEEAETEVMLSEDIGNIEVEAVENELATEKPEETEQSDDEMPKEARAVAAVENAAAIVKDSDNESKQPPVLKSIPVDDNPVAVNLGTSAMCEHEKTESLKSSDQFEVDTKPISAVTTLIGRFEHIAKHNATEAGSSRTSSRNSSRVSSPLPSPPSSWSRGNVFETVAKCDNAIENLEGPVREESNKENEDVLTEAETDQTAEVAVSVVESAAFEETPAIREKATISSVTETVADEHAPAAEHSLVVEASAIEVKSEAADEKSDEIEENVVAEVGVVEQELIDESTEAEVKIEKTLAAELEMVESSAEPEAEDVDLDLKTPTEEETPGIAEEANAPASEATDAYRALEEVPVADMAEAEADVETSETQMISADYKPTEASILSADGVEADAVWNEAVTKVQEVAEDVAPCATSFVDVEEAVATADFTTDEAVTTGIGEASSEFVSAMKETHVIYNEIQETQVEQKEVSQPMEISVRTDDGTLTDEATVAITSPVKKTVDDNMERTPERSSSPLIPSDQLTYEILGVTRANNVIMYHVYTINHATGEQAMSIPKRYSEFKVLDEQLRTLNGPSVRGLPVLPKPSLSTFLRGRRSQRTIEMREKAFGDLLQYVRDHDDLHQSTIFQQFIAH